MPRNSRSNASVTPLSCFRRYFTDEMFEHMRLSTLQKFDFINSQQRPPGLRPSRPWPPKFMAKLRPALFASAVL
jgi:hypothetical protein